jgi:hypothetical protein
MKYILRKDVRNEVPEITITEADYVAYKASRNALLNGFAIEEKYEILISNYLEFENEILVAASAASMVRNHIGYSDFFGFRLGLNLRLVNLLTSVRLYIDQVGQHVTECLTSRSDVKAVVKNLFSTEYDAHVEFMEALRNFVQHRGLPVHWASSGSNWTPDPRSPEAMLNSYVELGASRALLAEDEKFNKTVLAEIPEKVDLKKAARRYVECLSTVHAAVRKLIEETMGRSRRLLEEAHHSYGEVFKESLVTYPR